MKPLTVRVDLTRDMVLTANDRPHWATRAAKVKAVRALVGWQAAHALAGHRPPCWQHAQVDITVNYPKRARTRDVGNLHPTAKAAVDGLVDARVIAADDDAHLTGPFLHCDRRPATGATWTLIITVQETDERGDAA